MTGDQAAWTFDGLDGWITLRRAQFSGLAETFDGGATEAARGYAQPFLAALPKPGVVWFTSPDGTRLEPRAAIACKHSSCRLDDFAIDVGVEALAPDDWAAYAQTTIRPGPALARPFGSNAAEVRRRRRAEE